MARAANPAGVYRLERPCCRDDLIRPDLTSAGLLHSLSTTSKSRKLRAEQRLAALSTVDRLLRKRNPDPNVAADLPNPQSAAARIGTNSTIWVGAGRPMPVTTAPPTGKDFREERRVEFVWRPRWQLLINHSGLFWRPWGLDLPHRCGRFAGATTPFLRSGSPSSSITRCAPARRAEFRNGRVEISPCIVSPE